MKKAAQAETLRRVVSTRMPTRWGTFQTLGFEREVVERLRVETALAIVMGDVTAGRSVGRASIRSVSPAKCLGRYAATAENNWRLLCSAIAEEGRGLVIYEHQEGRGIGLMAKLRGLRASG